MAEIHDGGAWLFTAQNFRLLELLGQRVSIVRFPREASCTHDESMSGGNSNADLHAKLIRESGFPFADALHFRRMQGIELIFCLAVLDP